VLLVRRAEPAGYPTRFWKPAGGGALARVPSHELLNRRCRRYNCRSEGLSDTFIKYMRTWKGFVTEPVEEPASV
jgi:hypothetical protein